MVDFLKLHDEIYKYVEDNKLVPYMDDLIGWEYAPRTKTYVFLLGELGFIYKSSSLGTRHIRICEDVVWC